MTLKPVALPLLASAKTGLLDAYGDILDGTQTKKTCVLSLCQQLLICENLAENKVE